MPPTRLPLLARRSRLTTTLLVLLALFLLGTVLVLSTAKAYFSIDKSAYILPEELGTWEEIRWGAEGGLPAGWAERYPWLWRLLHNHGGSSAEVEGAAGVAGAGAATSPGEGDSPPEKIPRIIHQTWKSDVLPPKWQAVRDECAAMHPDYEYMLWTDATSRTFIAQHYPWFLPIFDAYPYAIQRADAIRYFVLHHYGGIYMDLDIGCRRRLDPLLRFEVVLPVTRPVGVSNDLIFAAKQHPFMDQTIHNLVTFNHRYLTHYPTVMFSTGPMFVSASYGLYVEAHGPASPSNPSDPAAGFKGVRVLPKSLYGKNAKESEVPDAFFRHYYGSSWHAGDAGFLIFLRDHGRLLMVIGGCVLAYGACRMVLPRLAFSWKKGQYRRVAGESRGARSSRRRGGADQGAGEGAGWIGLPLRDPTASRTQRRVSNLAAMRNTAQTPDTHLGLHRHAYGEPESPTPTAATSGPPRVAAPKPQRLSLPSFFEIDETEGEGEDDPSASDRSSDRSRPSNEEHDHEPTGLLAWAGIAGGADSSSSSLSDSSTAGAGPHVPRGWRSARGVLLLPAYLLSRMGSPSLPSFGASAGGRTGARRTRTSFSGEHTAPLPHHHAHHSPADSWSSSSSPPPPPSRSPSIVDRAAHLLLPRGWRGPVSGRGRTPVPGLDADADLELDNRHVSGPFCGEGQGEGERTPLAARAGEGGGGRRMSSSAWFDETAGSAPQRASGAFLTPSGSVAAQLPSGTDARTPPPPYDGAAAAAAAGGGAWPDKK
ncbi:hypothetical protein BDZ90DRAFT_230710 [Jaminaea rosea]|uniref:Glycosyltransferase family 32 protein n=1 Tax=Jaminaea rosea TaxID=1569628 RepID=A0A316UY06_9BASI|nr:hypothetical protein BDZ90DRAFT_230710 [Jaminaea rosea]PWN29874.1 hypothetical protein BDZ90DRAFT_230710 [Jaminaea rosea]